MKRLLGLIITLFTFSTAPSFADNNNYAQLSIKTSGTQDKHYFLCIYGAGYKNGVPPVRNPEFNQYHSLRTTRDVRNYLSFFELKKPEQQNKAVKAEKRDDRNIEFVTYPTYLQSMQHR